MQILRRFHVAFRCSQARFLRGDDKSFKPLFIECLTETGYNRLTAMDKTPVRDTSSDKSSRARLANLGCQAIGILIAILVAIPIVLFTMQQNQPDGSYASQSEAAGKMAEEFVKKKINAPPTSRYLVQTTRDTVTYVSAGKYSVSGFVDKPNAFGIGERYRWTVVLHLNPDKKWTADSVSVDD